MKVPHYVVGHRNPDTDSIVSAHVQAWILNQRRGEGQDLVIPIRLGAANPQTEWLFEYAGVPLPIERGDCRVTVGDLAHSAYRVSAGAPLTDALEIIRHEQTRLVGIVDSEGELSGVIGSRTPRINLLLQSRVEDYGGVLLDMDLLQRGLGLKEIRGHHKMHEADRLVVAASSEERLRRDLRSGDIVVCGLHPECIEYADAARAKAVICCTYQLEELDEVIGRTTVPVYHFPESIITLIGKLPGSVPCWAVMEDKYGVVEASTPLADTRKLLAEYPEGLMVMENGRFVGTFHQYHLLNPPRPKLSLVDHFERAQSIEGSDEAEIVQIIDHHRIGDIETDGPVEIDCRQWGSTASILFSRMETLRINPSKEIATLLLGALLSDTLGLHSPTTTDIDRQIAESLALIAGVELNAFLLTLLLKNDQISTADPERLLKRDCKEFTYGNVRFVVSQIETVDLSGLTAERELELTEAFQLVVERHGCAFGVMMVTDVLKKQSLLRLVSRDQKWGRILLPDIRESTEPRWLAEDWVSRKSQVIPFIMQRMRSA